MKMPKFDLSDKLLITAFTAWLVYLAYLSVDGEKSVFLAGAVIYIIALAFCLVLRLRQGRQRLNMLRQLSKQLSPEEARSLEEFPMPCMVVDKELNLQWYNGGAAKILCGNGVVPTPLNECSSGISLDFKGDSALFNATVSKVGYSVYARKLVSNDEELFVLYLHNDDILKKINALYRLSRPSVMIIEIDNFDELLKEMRDLERTHVVAAVEDVILTWIKSSSGVLSRYSRDKYMVVLEERDLKKYIDNKFDVLEQIHSIENKAGVMPTISIGIGKGCKTLSAAEMAADEALDMALGRGGDQVVIKEDNNYHFFGGTLKGMERSSRVRSRIVASNVANLIKNSANVIIMGHKMSDLDCVGAAVGLQFAVTALGREARIVVNRDATMSADLINAVTQSGLEIFVSPEQACRIISEDTLLIVVDTHRKEMMEAPELCDMVKKIIVIDHHRKTVDHIQNTALMYHEPNSSSTCEMVVELIQYLDCGNPSKLQSEALLSGIMLDTKNFSNQTGVRTFEAAAYLKRRGADTVNVKRLFLSSFDEYRKKAQLLSNTVTYKGTAIAVWADKYDDSLRLVAAQAADELLSVKGVLASFTVFASPDAVIISGRSTGKLNVQLVAEQLGGGGHHTMAGAQMKETTLEEGINALKNAIDKVINENTLKALNDVSV